MNDHQQSLYAHASLSITMSDSKGKDSKKYKAKITALEEKKRFSFFAIMMAKFMFSADRIIKLEDSEKGTLLIQKEIYTGIMLSMFWGKLSTQAKDMLESMNVALKDKQKTKNKNDVQ